ncbi:MAG: 3-mercaptopyruvate sulfurtransferase [Myxococcota bacterium]
MELPRPLVSADWLVSQLEAPDLVVLDASWYPPTEGRDPRAEHRSARIPGARFFDIEEISDRESDLPHMAPLPSAFEAALATLGIGEGTRVVVYDGHGLLSAPRAWWMFRAFGKEEVTVLDGGLPVWREAGRPMESGSVATPVPPRVRFEARPDPTWLADRDQVRAALASGKVQVVDARAAARFRGEAPEPRPGLRSGHLPGSRNLPWLTLLDEDRCLRDEAQLQAAFEDAGVRPDAPVITTCGSGVTAAILSLALDRLGRRSAVYDGSWADWGRPSELPVAAGDGSSDDELFPS